MLGERGAEIIRTFQHKAVYKLASVLFTIAAFIAEAVPSVLYIHQPEIPEELLK
ncbi:cyclic lactone autoinducer peptide [Paenibacillus typhae]|uniref:cyclic lactone autoinducer peptide n=1 Tax=Paenibacillus typhae TaxID=1174501 RepID=UPI000B89BD92